MTQPFVSAYRGYDPLRAQMLSELLVREGIDARLIGTQNASLLGAGEMIFAQRIEVPEAELERALELIEQFTTEAPIDEASEAWREGGAGHVPLASAASEDSQAAEAPSAPMQRSARIAAVLPWIFPGAGHFYVGQKTTAALLFGTFVANVWLSIEHQAWCGKVIAFFVVLPLVLDFVGAQLALRKQSSRPLPQPVQMLIGGAFALLVLGGHYAAQQLLRTSALCAAG